VCRRKEKYCVSLVKLRRFRIMKDMNAQLIRNENVIRDDLEITHPKRTDLQSGSVHYRFSRSYCLVHQCILRRNLDSLDHT